jgi:large subunit ribosomal protein L4
MKLKVYTTDGKQTGAVDVSDEIFGGEVNSHLLHQIVKSYLANKRQGTSKTKTRDEVSGGGRKPWKQKGTGRARSGSNTSPVWVRGGKAHGPVPRSYYSVIPQSMRRIALQQALTERIKGEKVLVVDALSCNPAKTKTMATILKALPLTGVRNLILTDGVKEDVFRSGRNIPNVRIIPVATLNALDVLSSDNIILGARDLAGKLEQAVAR